MEARCQRRAVAVAGVARRSVTCRAATVSCRAATVSCAGSLALLTPRVLHRSCTPTHTAFYILFSHKFKSQQLINSITTYSHAGISIYIYIYQSDGAAAVLGQSRKERAVRLTRPREAPTHLKIRDCKP